MANIEISRSFSRKLQVKQYEPAEFFCSAKQECDEKDVVDVSAKLDKICQDEVGKTISKFIKSMDAELNSRSIAKEKKENNFDANDFL
ncbi:hypothetical protein LCGC14_2329790 [marine sediment metagenome]|uniref:Uncharacterized protein n=1 Tax=marine sediment metagenome TaxID=412755 RepID=A0A0F9CFX2_9ZZZZ